MRLLLICLPVIFCGSVGFAQIDSTTRPITTQPQPMVPGVNSPISAPGTLMQSSARPNVAPAPRSGKRKRRFRTVPPSDPRAFGVAVPLGETRKDSIRN